MKKWLITIFLLLGIVTVPLIWWNMQSSVSSGVYPEKHAGSVVIKVEDDSPMTGFKLPMQWIKSYPWEDPPNLENITLLNEDGEVIAAIEGKYRLEVDSNQNKWNKRVVGAEIELYLNGERLVEEDGIITKPISNTLENTFLPDQLSLTYKGRKVIFPMDHTYKIFPITKLNYDSVSKWEMEGLMPFPDADTSINKGFIVKLKGLQNSTLIDILFWLPGK
jgi:hypothetical protein